MRVLCVVFLFLPVCLSLVINSTIREKEGISYSDNIKIAQWQVSFDEPGMHNESTLLISSQCSPPLVL